MATDVSTQRISSEHENSGEKLSVLSRYACLRAAAIDVLTSGVVGKPGSQEKGFNVWFPPVCMVRVILQLMNEYLVWAVVIVFAEKDKWYPTQKAACVRETLVANAGSGSAFLTNHHVRGERPFVFGPQNMIAVDLDFSLARRTCLARGTSHHALFCTRDR